MRIAIDARSLQEKYPSGVSTYTREFIRTLLQHPNAQRHSVVLFCNAATARHQPKWLNQLQELCKGHNAKLRIRTWPNKVVTAGHALFSTPTDHWMFGNADVVLVDSIHFYPFRRTHIPYVVVVHDLSFERFPDCLSFKGRLWHRMLQPRQFMQRAAHCVAVSQHTALDLHTLYRLPKEQVSVVYPGLPPVTSGNVLNVQLPAIPKKYILWCSTVEPRKNIETLLQALEVIRQQDATIELIIIGTVVPRQQNIVRKYANQVPTTLLGYVDDAVKRAVIARATVVVYPSLYEGFGFPPLEAQQLGVPVIVGANSSMPEVCGEGALYVDVHNSNALQRAIHHVLTDDVLRHRLIQRGKENIQRFSWQRTVEQILGILNQTASQTHHTHE